MATIQTYVRRCALAVFALALATYASGCFSHLEKVDGTGGLSPWGQPGRVYLKKNRWDGSRVVVCDARPDGVSCYDTDNSNF